MQRSCSGMVHSSLACVKSAFMPCWFSAVLQQTTASRCRSRRMQWAQLLHQPHHPLQHLAVHALAHALVQQPHTLPQSHLTCNTSSGSNPFSPLAAPSSCRKRRILSLRPSGPCPCGCPLCCCARKKSRLCCKAALLSRCCCALVPLADRWVAADCQPGPAGAPACSDLPMAASSRFTAAWMTCEAGCNKVRELHAAPAGGCRICGLKDRVQRCPQAHRAPSLQHR